MSVHGEDLGNHYISRGSHYEIVGPHIGLGYADKAIKILAAGFKADPRLAVMRERLIDAYVLRARCLIKLERWDDALRACDLGTAVDAAAANEPALRNLRRLVALALRWKLESALQKADKGQHVEAANIASGRVEGPLRAAALSFTSYDWLGGLCGTVVANDLASRGPAVGVSCYDAARVFTRCAAKVEKTDPELAETYTRRAMTLVLRAWDEGFMTTAEGRKLFETDPDLNRLRGRKEFQVLSAKLQPRP